MPCTNASVFFKVKSGLVSQLILRLETSLTEIILTHEKYMLFDLLTLSYYIEKQLPAKVVKLYPCKCTVRVSTFLRRVSVIYDYFHQDENLHCPKTNFLSRRETGMKQDYHLVETIITIK